MNKHLIIGKRLKENKIKTIFHMSSAQLIDNKLSFVSSNPRYISLHLFFINLTVIHYQLCKKL